MALGIRHPGAGNRSERNDEGGSQPSTLERSGGSDQPHKTPRYNEAYVAFGDQRDVLLEMHRIAHRQFPWQTGVGVNPLMRAFRIFGRSAVEAIVIREFGLTMRQILLIGMAMIGHFQKSACMSNYDCSELGVPQDSSRLLCTSYIYNRCIKRLDRKTAILRPRLDLCLESA
jgi:hypothetical protein